MIDNETLKIIKQRRSVRSFKEEQIKEEELQAVLEAGLYAPNASGLQEWHFTVIQNKEMLDKLNHTAKEAAGQLGIEGLKQLADNEEFNCFYSAPTLILISANAQGIPLEADCAAANQNLLLASESIGLGSCWIYFVMFAFDSPQGDQLRKELGIPEGYKPYHSAVLGYKKEAVVDAPDRKPDRITYIR